MIAHLYANGVPNDPTPHYAGELAYVDTLRGLVPCRVDRVHVVPSGIRGLDFVSADVTITAARPGWKRGDRETVNVRNVVPRGSVFTRAGVRRIRNDYVWRVTP